jgi:hypothetical protein
MEGLPFLIMLLFTNYLYVGMRAFQQLNVVNNRWLWIPPTTFVMACVEVYNLITIVKQENYWAVVPMTIGGALGCWSSMWYHNRAKRKEKECSPEKK